MSCEVWPICYRVFDYNISDDCDHIHVGNSTRSLLLWFCMGCDLLLKILVWWMNGHADINLFARPQVTKAPSSSFQSVKVNFLLYVPSEYNPRGLEFLIFVGTVSFPYIFQVLSLVYLYVDGLAKTHEEYLLLPLYGGYFTVFLFMVNDSGTGHIINMIMR